MMSLKSLRILNVRICFIALTIVRAFSAIIVFYRCRDNPIQYTSTFNFNCSNPNEVIYVESSIIGFTPLYKADKNVLECPITSDTCTKTSPVPSTSCNGYNSCSLAQRILLYNESGVQCNIDSGGNWGGNFINVNYSCINIDLCYLRPGFIDRYSCSPKTTASSSDNRTNPTNLTVTTAESFSSAGTITNSSGHRTTIFALPYLTQGAIIGIIVGSFIFAIIITVLTILLIRRRKRLKDICRGSERPAAGLEQTFNQETIHDFNIDSNFIAYDQAAPVGLVVQAKTGRRMTSESKGNGYSYQPSVYEMVEHAIIYDTVRNSSITTNADNRPSENETVTNETEKNNPDIVIAGKNNDQGNSRTTLNQKPLAQKRKMIYDKAVEPEYAEVRTIGSNYSSPSPIRSNSDGNYYNCTAVGMSEKVSGEMVDCSTGDRSHEDDEGDYVDWEPEISDCAYGEITLVDNDLYADEFSV